MKINFLFRIHTQVFLPDMFNPYLISLSCNQIPLSPIFMKILTIAIYILLLIIDICFQNFTIKINFHAQLM